MNPEAAMRMLFIVLNGIEKVTFPYHHVGVVHNGVNVVCRLDQ